MRMGNGIATGMRGARWKKVGGADAQAFVVPQELVDAQKTPYGAAKQELQVAKCRKRISIGENEPMFSFQFHQLSIRAMTSMA